MGEKRVHGTNRPSPCRATAESLGVTGLLSAAYSIGQPHLVVGEFKALGSPTVGGRLLVTLSDFHSLSGCLFSCWKSR